LDNSKKFAIMALACIVLSVAVAAVASAQYDDYYGDTPMDDWGAALGLGALSGLCCFFIFIPFIIGLLIAIWVYKDAEKRGKSGVLWLLLVWLTFPIGLIIWLVVRPPIGGEKKAAASDRRCPNCGRGIPNDARTCPYCGKNFEG